MSKLRRYLTLAFVIFLCSAAFGMLVSIAERGKNPLYGMSKYILMVGRFPVLLKGAYNEIRHPVETYTITKNRFKTCGVQNYDKEFKNSDYFLTSSYDKNLHQVRIKLMRISDATIIHSWIPPVKLILDELKRIRKDFYSSGHNERNFTAEHPMLCNNGSIIFNPQYGPLIKLDKNSKIEWILPQMFHHSLERDSEGNIWTCVLKDSSEYQRLFRQEDMMFKEDEVICINEDGKTLFRKSVIDIFEKSMLRGLILGSGSFDKDPVHLNDVQPVMSDGKFWKKGDLLLSLRNLSLVCLYRPETDSLLWYRFGPWVCQHDVDIQGDGIISVFGNDLMRFENRMIPIEKHNDIYFIDLESQTITKPYTNLMAQEKVSTSEQGSCEVLENGTILIDQTDNGRIFIGNKDNVLWSYTDCYSKDKICIFGWCRYIKNEKINFENFK